MKSILLTSTALVALAGAAAADGHTSIDFSGGAKLGYNDDVENGFYSEITLDVAMSATLDNGITVSASADVDELDAGKDFAGVQLKIASENASLTYGDVDPATDGFNGVDGTDATGFNDKDAHLKNPADGLGFDAILLGEASFGIADIALSYGVDADLGDDEDTAGGLDDNLDALQLLVGASLGQIDLQLAYQDELAGADSVFAIGAKTTLAGADLTLEYSDNGATTSTGIAVSYPIGDAITVGGYYAINDADEDNYGLEASYADGPVSVDAALDHDGDADTNKITLEGSYDLGNGMKVFAGYISNDSDADDNQYYVAGTYDLGGGASLLVSYADDEASDTNDEIGDPEYNSGTTVEVSFSF